MLAVLSELGVERFDLIGHDWGAFTGFLICATAPERVGHYLGCSIPHPWPPQERPSLRRLFNLWYQVALATPGLGAGLMRNGSFTAQVLQVARSHGDYTPDELAAFVDVLREPEPRPRDLAVLPHVPAARAASVHVGRVQAAEDRHADPPAVGPPRPDPPGRPRPRRPRALRAEHEIEWVDDTGHFLPEERPELVVAAGARAVRSVVGERSLSATRAEPRSALRRPDGSEHRSSALAPVRPRLLRAARHRHPVEQRASDPCRSASSRSAPSRAGADRSSRRAR